MNTTLETQLQKAINTVNWDNWTDDETDEPMKLGDVYWNKLEWVKEHLKDDEMLDIITDLQETIVPILNELDKY
jgi:hypothetical protein